MAGAAVTFISLTLKDMTHVHKIHAKYRRTERLHRVTRAAILQEKEKKTRRQQTAYFFFFFYTSSGKRTYPSRAVVAASA